MGTWNTDLFSNDTTCDVRDTYMNFLKQDISDEDAYKKTYDEYKELIGTDEESLFWYALADTQWDVGRLMINVKKTALEFIDNNGGSSLWNENIKMLVGWKKTLKKLREKIESPMPKKKRITKLVDFKKNPWNVGDVYAYEFHSDNAQKYGLIGKYILFQKIGNVSYYDGEVFSAIQVFDNIFDFVPTLNEIENLRILPLVNPIENSDLERYTPSFEWYMKAVMIYEKNHIIQRNICFLLVTTN